MTYQVIIIAWPKKQTLEGQVLSRSGTYLHFRCRLRSFSKSGRMPFNRFGVLQGPTAYFHILSVRNKARGRRKTYFDFHFSVRTVGESERGPFGSRRKERSSQAILSGEDIFGEVPYLFSLLTSVNNKCVVTACSRIKRGL